MLASSAHPQVETLGRTDTLTESISGGVWDGGWQEAGSISPWKLETAPLPPTVTHFIHRRMRFRISPHTRILHFNTLIPPDRETWPKDSRLSSHMDSFSVDKRRERNNGRNGLPQHFHIKAKVEMRRPGNSVPLQTF